MVFCHKCGAEQVESSEFCCKCGAKLVLEENQINSENVTHQNTNHENIVPVKRKSSVFKKIIIILGFLAALIAIVSRCGGGETSQKTNEQSSEKQQNDENYSEDIYFEWVEEPTLVEDDKINHICGSIKNISGKDLYNLFINFVAYDADGNELGTYCDLTHNLKSGNTWKFTVDLYKEAVSYEFVNVEYDEK